ncbi:PEP/pyruvate-binding domain-containing protein [Hyphococcus luteus]|uniref:Phosphoenolpyruvate synthase n=1 Tax=Hyphococcus luteus TaxID=2058213 RepID=A0A2S7JZJ2_9PROT|nr:PEP/pyruvate-binding domain-containing protein [Marinicaulis flavus]PQA85681.1 phosphoenolpyruvate synthase [Marinicaulis flavus]
MTNENISWFSDIGLEDRPTVGGKGGSLGELTKAGIAVPPGFVVRTEGFERFIQKLDKEEPLRAPVEALDPDDYDTVGKVTAAIRERIEKEPLPAEVETEIKAAYAELCEGDAKAPVAVRSSATTEDAEDASFAGLQDTYLWVLGAEETLQMVRRCWASLYSVESVCYRRRQDFPESGVAMGVVVQRMVDARTAGVMFTRSPLTGDRSVITIEGAWGLGSAVVSGEVTPDRWVVGKLTGEITTREISKKHIRQSPKADGGIEDVALPEEEQTAASLSDDELQKLRDIARKTEKHYGRPQDIEWAVDRDGSIFLLQSRPETVWSAKDDAPVAKPETDPKKHVMSIFGGRR